MDNKDIKALIKIMRTTGVLSLKTADIELHLSPEALQLEDKHQDSQPSPSDDPATPFANFPEGILTNDQLMFYSSGGSPEDDPENKSGGSN